MKLITIGLAVLTIAMIFLRPSFGEAANVSTTVVTTAAATTLTQNDYRWYENVNALNPTTASAGLNTAADTPAQSTVVRLRINISDTGVELAAGAQFKLQFSNSTSSGFADVGTSTGSWIFSDNVGVADGATIAVTLLGSSDVGESYNESNPSAATPNIIGIGQEGEFDWVIKNNSAATTQNWFFRIIYSSSTVLDAYANYPALNAVSATPTPAKEVTIGGGGVSLPYLEPLIPPSPCDEPSVQGADLNRDCLIDIIDLSILLFYYGRSGPEVVLFDLDGNSVVDFPDVSIMMFYWTGSRR